MALLNIPNKINPDNSLIHLLEENNCLKDSLTVINDNFNSFQKTLLELEEHGKDWNYIYSVVAANSAFWILVADDIERYNTQWTSGRSVVNSLSASWIKEFNMTWPNIVKQKDWYTGTSSGQTVSQLYINTHIPQWLNSIFPPANYDYRQKITVNVMLQYDQLWNFETEQSMYEPCIPGGNLVDNGYNNANFKKKGAPPGKAGTVNQVIVPTVPQESEQKTKESPKPGYQKKGNTEIYIIDPGFDPCKTTENKGVPQWEGCTPKCSYLVGGKTGGKRVIEERVWYVKEVYKITKVKTKEVTYEETTLVSSTQFVQNCWIYSVERYATSLACATCPNTFSRGCNHHGGRAGHGDCDNAFAYCTLTNQTVELAQGCESQGAGQVVLYDNWTGSDTMISRILNIPYKKLINPNGSSSWVLDTSRQIT